MRSFGEWMFDSFSAKPVRTVATPRAASAETRGIAPPERTSNGRTPSASSKASSPRTTARASDGIRPGGADERSVTSRSVPGGRCSAKERFERRYDDSGILVTDEPDRDVRLGFDRDHGLLEHRGASLDPVHVHGWLGPRAQVELLGRGGVGRSRSGRRDLCRPGREAVPAGAFGVGGSDDPDPQLLGEPAVAREHGRKRLHQGMHRVERGTAVHAGMKITATGAHRDVEVAETANRDVEAGDVALDHAAVENDRGVSPTLVGCDPVDDRVATDLLLTVAGEAQVHGQLSGRGEKLRCLEQHVELPLVVCGTTGVEPAVALDELEGRRLPELERVGRLHVEMAVTEDRRRGIGVLRGADLADDERPLPPGDHLGRRHLRVGCAPRPTRPRPRRRPGARDRR